MKIVAIEKMEIISKVEYEVDINELPSILKHNFLQEVNNGCKNKNTDIFELIVKDYGKIKNKEFLKNGNTKIESIEYIEK